MHYCSQEKEKCALLFLREENRDTIVIRRRKLVLYCSQGEGNWCSTAYVFRKRGLVFYCSQEKETGALLFSGEEIRCSKLSTREGNWCFTDLWRKKLLLYCSQEKETGALLFSRRRKLALYCSCFRRRGLVLYCSQVKGDWAVLLRTEVVQGAVPSLLVDSDESRQLAIVKFGKHFGFCFQQKIIGFIGFI